MKVLKTGNRKKETKIHKFIKEHFMVIVMIAIMLIPSIYTVLFLGSMWDPYGNTESLPVAVVNQDKTVVYNGEKINIGEQLCENLASNNSLQFNFVDENVALKGLENGTYYMVMIVPQNFSANSTTLTTNNPQKMKITYYTNPGTNYIASKFGESAIKSIKESLNQTVIKTYAQTVYSKLDTIGSGFNTAADGSNQIYNGISQLKSGNFQICNGLETLSNGCLTLKEGTGTLENGLNDYTDGVTQVDDGVYQLVEGSSQLGNGTNQLKNGIRQLKAGTEELTDNNEKLNQGAKELLNGLELMSDSLNKQLTPEVVEETPKKLESIITYLEEIQKIADKYNLDEETIKKIQTAVGNANNFVNSDSFETIYNLMENTDLEWEQVIKTIENLEKLPISNETKQMLEQLKTFAEEMQKIQGFKHDFSKEDIQDAMNTVNGFVSSDDFAQNADLSHLVGETTETVNSVEAMFNGLVEIQHGLNKTMEKDGETGLIEGMTTLKNGIYDYTNGVSTVNEGVTQLSNGIDLLDDGVGQSKAGINKLYNGTQTLTSNNEKLTKGASDLNSGATQLFDGSIKLYNGTTEIDDGCDRLMKGANTLETSLKDGANQIEETNTDESAAEMFSMPVEAEEVFQRNINSNGEAMSAYMMCAGLWVACLAFCLMFSPFKTSLQKRKTFVSHGFIAGFVATVAPIIMVTLIMLIDGMQPANVLNTYLMAILASWAFMAIVYFLNTLLDSIGSFILLVLLCLNLSGAAGTYPIDLSPKFYQIIHPFMPFTYGVDAFRSTISTGNSLTKDIIVFSAITIICIVLTCITYELRKIKLKRKESENKYEQLEEELEYYNSQEV